MTTLITGTICIFVFHWIADYVLQKGEWAKAKSADPVSLLKHTSLYSVMWFIPMIPLLGIIESVIFVAVTFFIHTYQDSITSQTVKEMFESETYYTPLPNVGVFSFMGFDQLLHYLQLYILFILLL